MCVCVFQLECASWVHNSKLMLCDLTGDPYPDLPPILREASLAREATLEAAQETEAEKETLLQETAPEANAVATDEGSAEETKQAETNEQV